MVVSVTLPPGVATRTQWAFRSLGSCVTVIWYPYGRKVLNSLMRRG